MTARPGSRGLSCAARWVVASGLILGWTCRALASEPFGEPPPSTDLHLRFYLITPDGEPLSKAAVEITSGTQTTLATLIEQGRAANARVLDGIFQGEAIVAHAPRIQVVLVQGASRARGNQLGSAWIEVPPSSQVLVAWRLERTPAGFRAHRTPSVMADRPCPPRPGVALAALLGWALMAAASVGLFIRVRKGG